MATTVWKGYLAFGLVSIPVRLFRAARPGRVPLRQLYRSRPSEGAPTHPSPAAQRASVDARAFASEVIPARRVYEPSVQTEEPPEGEATTLRASELVKGYEYEKGRYVVLDKQDLRSVAPEETGEKAYALLFDAMRSTGYAAIEHLAMHRRDHVVIVRTGKTGLLAHTMFYPDEVRSAQEFHTDTGSVAAKELDLAKSLIRALATSFDPGKFKNAFRERLRKQIDARAGEQQIAPVASQRPEKVVDIMDALRRSLAQAAAPGESEVPPKKSARRQSGSTSSASNKKRRRLAQ